jgi:hypothetical protein
MPATFEPYHQGNLRHSRGRGVCSLAVSGPFASAARAPKPGTRLRAYLVEVSAHIEVSDNGRIYRVPRAKAIQKVLFGAFRWVDAFHIARHTRTAVVFDGWLGTGNALPFSRIQNKMLKPVKLHYEIPACGARSRPQWCAEINASGDAA